MQTAIQIAEALERWNLPSTTDEMVLHQSVAKVLELEGIPFEHEKIISKQERLDFLCEGGVAIEVKTAGSSTALAMQLQRYAASDDVTGIVVVTSQKRHRLSVSEIGGKPLRVVWIFKNF